MIRRTFAVGVVLAAGSLIAAALYWLLLNTPESNALMLVASLVIVLALVAVVAVTVNGAVLSAHGASFGTALVAGARGIGWFLVALAPLVAGWWVIGQGDDWIARHQSEIQAWFIARFGWADITRLLQAELWVSRWLRWAVLPMASLSLLSALLTRSRPSGWLRHASHWRTLLVATAVFILLFALPWQLTRWRPELPPTWVEPAIAGLRLGLVFLFGLLGAAVMIIASAGSAPAARSFSPDRQP